MSEAIVGQAQLLFPIPKQLISCRKCCYINGYTLKYPSGTGFKVPVDSSTTATQTPRFLAFTLLSSVQRNINLAHALIIEVNDAHAESLCRVSSLTDFLECLPRTVARLAQPTGTRRLEIICSLLVHATSVPGTLLGSLEFVSTS